MDSGYDTSKYDAFFDYCNKNLNEKKLRICKFTSEKDTSVSFYNYYPIDITYGYFIIQVDISYFVYNNKHYGFGFQYQNETLKLNCSRPGIYYKTSELEEIMDLIPVFKTNVPSNYRINPPKTRAYISMSRKERGVSKLPNLDFSMILFEEFIKFIKIVDKMKSSFNSIGCKFIN